MRPDRGAGDRPGRAATSLTGDLAKGGHVVHGNDHFEIPGLGAGGLDEGDRGPTVKESGDFLDGAHRRREANALGRFGEQRVQPLEAQGEVGAPFGSRDRVDFVEDDCLDAGEGLPGRRGEQQEQRLGGRDQDVARPLGEGAAVGRRGVPGADRDGDVRGLQAESNGGVADPDEGRAQVALDVDCQRLHRRDIEHPAALERLRGAWRARQPIQRPEEGGERLARPRRRDD